MVQLTHNVVEGKRPPLGVLLLDDGTTFSLNTDVVIGRAPESSPAVKSGKVQPLVVDDEERSLSRVHALVELSGWDVRIKDCGSANGTAVQAPGASDWTVLAADVPTTLADGARVRCGKRTFVYDARHRR
jgi:pSer/pThr/pTyr-binding forkhead associated (FHA) protein